MSNQISLEHCHTNLFALTNISCIRWKCMVAKDISSSSDSANDPVLSSFANCLNDDILCVWRKTLANKPNMFVKELWIFWFDEEPSASISPELKVKTKGILGEENLTYECRVLIFKAFHNLIEKCLLRKGFARFGKWFVLPSDKNIESKIPRLSFSFEFFLHGETKICSSIDVREHASVRCISESDLIRSRSETVSLILAPYGLRARLIGAVDNEDHTSFSSKLLSEWAKFYPLRSLHNVPDLVEVVVGNTRMIYPSCYAYFVEEEKFKERLVKLDNLKKKVNDSKLFKDVVNAACCDISSRLGTDGYMSNSFMQGTNGCCSCSSFQSEMYRNPSVLKPNSNKGGGCVPFHRRNFTSELSSSLSPVSSPVPSTPSTLPSATLAGDAVTPTVPEGTPTSAPSNSPAPLLASKKEVSDSSRLENDLKRTFPETYDDYYSDSSCYDSTALENLLTIPLKRLKMNSVNSLVDNSSHEISELTPPLSIPENAFSCSSHGSPNNMEKFTEHSESKDHVFQHQFTKEDDDYIKEQPMSQKYFCSLDEILTPPDSDNPSTCNVAAVESKNSCCISVAAENELTENLADLHLSPIIDFDTVCFHTSPSMYSPLSLHSSPSITVSYEPSVFRWITSIPSHVVFNHYSPANAVWSADAFSAPCSLESPLSNASSSLLNRTLNSVEALGMGQTSASVTAAGDRLLPEAHSLILNTILSDSVFNIFRDLHFDSCIMCTCQPDCIKGLDYFVYLQSGPAETLPKESCSCGFSAVVNQKLAYGGGLFLEDELEIFGEASISHVPSVSLPSDVIELVQKQVSTPFYSNLLSFFLKAESKSATTLLKHESIVLVSAMESARMVFDKNITNPLCDSPSLLLHSWRNRSCPVKDIAVSQLLLQLKPVLQEALQKKGVVARLWDTVAGPLTWKHFHQLLNDSCMQEDQNCEPLPIPHLTIGSGSSDKDCLHLSPFSIHFWENLCLEPYSASRDIAYLVLVPECALYAAFNFFSELSCKYELLKFGYHRPALRLAPPRNPHGFVSLTAADNDDLTKAYVTALRTWIAGPLQSGLVIDSSIFREPPGSECFKTSMSSLSHTDHGNSTGTGAPDDIPKSMYPPTLVVYLVDISPSPSFTNLFSAFTEAVYPLKDVIKDSLQVHLVPFTWLHDLSITRQLSFVVFSETTRKPVSLPPPKSLTDFGIEQIPIPPYSSLRFTPPYIIAGNIHTKLKLSSSQNEISSTTLFCSYCLSIDQKFLLAVCCDEKCELLESCVINIDTCSGPVTRSKQRLYRYARQTGICKLWEFLLSVVARTCSPWRIIINRLGRIGHGELKGWGCLISRRGIQNTANYLREHCDSCSFQNYGEIPTVLSACLISMEPHANFRVLPESVCEKDTNAAGISNSNPLNGVSCTHVLAFPTSAVIQISQQFQMQNDSTLHDLDLLFDLDIESSDIGPLLSPPGSPKLGDRFSNVNFGDSSGTGVYAIDKNKDTLTFLSDKEENPQLDQQPLAVGLYVSTAPPDRLPHWTSRGLNDGCSTFKVTLHLNVPCAQQTDEMLFNSVPPETSLYCHPLDSHTTYVPLRYILEHFHQLSWLSLNEQYSDRRSCLPVHIDVLLQLYHTFRVAFV